MAEAASANLHAEALADYFDSWEAEHGPLSSDELAAAAAELGLLKTVTTEPASGTPSMPPWWPVPIPATAS